MTPGEQFDPRNTFVGLFIPEGLAASPRISSHAKLVYGHLVRRAGQNGVCWPSIMDIAKHIGLSERVTQRALKELRVGEYPLIRVTERRHDSGRQTSNEFSFVWGPLLEPFPKEGVKNDTPVKNDTLTLSETTPSGVTITTPSGVSVLTPKKRNSKSETGKEKKETTPSSSSADVKTTKVVSASTEPTTEPRWKPDATELQHVMDALNECGLQPPVDPSTTRNNILTHMKNVADFEKWLAYNSHNLAKARDWGLHVYYAKLWHEHRDYAPEVVVVARKPRETCTHCKQPSGTNQECAYCRWAGELRRAKITGKEPDYSMNPGLLLM